MSISKVKRYENGKEIVGQVDTPYKITWNAWQLLTDTEKEKHKWLITDVPGADGFITVENMKLLWSNPSPTADFTAQQITLSSDDYDMLLICHSDNNSGITEKGRNCLLCRASNSSSTYVNTFERNLVYVNDTTYSVGNGISQNSGVVRATNNAVLKPLTIYGFKKQTEIRFNALAQNVKATVDYSTDEHPIGTWIDGSTLYEKTINFGALPNNNITTVNHNIANIDKIISIGGIAITSSLALPIPNAPATTNDGIYVDASPTNIRIRCNSDRSAYTGYVTLRYTKTT